MPSRTLRLDNESGLHARPARILARAAAAHAGTVTIAKDAAPVDAKSVLSVLTLDCHRGDEITITTDGPDSAVALDQLVALVQEGLGE